METRKITIVDSATQTVKVINSAATTLGELKHDIAAAGLSTVGKIFYEGVSKLELTDDASMLPHDIPYKGTITNNLAIRMTMGKKNISSGAMSRMDAYAYIKEHDLKEDVFAKFGKNFTTCKTNDLIDFISKHDGSSTSKPTPKTATLHKPLAKPEVNKEVINVDALSEVAKSAIASDIDTAINALKDAKKHLENNNSDSSAKDINDHGYTKEELEELF